MKDEKFWERKVPKELILHTKNDGIIYKYVSFETAIRILESNSLNYSPASSFNDPFDLSLEFLDLNFSKDEIVDLLGDWKIDIKIKNKAINHYFQNPNELSEIVLEMLESQRSEIGITCFSKSPMKTLMWSHYANKHSGICLGFSFKDELEKFIQAEISYKNKIKPIHYVRDTRLAFYKWFFTKSHVWSYEEEIRRVSNIGNGLVPFRKNELKEVYFGLELKQQQIDFFNNLLEINLFKIKKQSKMEMNKNTFDLKEVEI